MMPSTWVILSYFIIQIIIKYPFVDNFKYINQDIVGDISDNFVIRRFEQVVQIFPYTQK